LRGSFNAADAELLDALATAESFWVSWAPVY